MQRTVETVQVAAEADRGIFIEEILDTRLEGPRRVKPRGNPGRLYVRPAAAKMQRWLWACIAVG